MKIKNWIACVQDRGKWKEVVEKAKISIRKFSAWKKKILFLVYRSYCIPLHLTILHLLIFVIVRENVYVELPKIFFYLPTAAQVNCLKNNLKIYIKIDIKTALTCFGVITIIRERTV